MVQHVWTLAQSSNDSAAGAIALLVQLAIIVLTFVGMWKVFVKAGHPGWAAIVPIYNLYILTQIAGRAWWWLILLFIPVVNLIVILVLCSDISKAFGRGLGTTIGLFFLPFIFYPILGFGSAQYQGPTRA
jgi:hypothetical protein